MDLIFELPARRGATLALVTHDPGARRPLRPRHPDALGRGRGHGARPGMNAPVAPPPPRAARRSCASRCATCAAASRACGSFSSASRSGSRRSSGSRASPRALDDGLARQGRVDPRRRRLLLAHPPPPRAGRQAFLGRYGRLSTIATVRAMARAENGDAALVEVKAVEPSWPSLGAASLAPPIAPAEALAEKDGAFGAAAEEALLARLNLKLGDAFRLGEATFVLRAVVASEPDRLAAGVGFGPRLLISQAALEATRLVQPGSLVRWTTRVVMDGPGGAAGRGRGQGLPRGGQARLSRGGLGDALAPRRLARLQPQPRPLRRVPDARGTAVAGRRRRRRRQRGAGLRRAEARDAGDPEGDRRDRDERRRARRDRVPDRRARSASLARRSARRGDSVRGRRAVRRRHRRSRSARRSTPSVVALGLAYGLLTALAFAAAAAVARPRPAGHDADPRPRRGAARLAARPLSRRRGARGRGARRARRSDEPAADDRARRRRRDARRLRRAAARGARPRARGAPRARRPGRSNCAWRSPRSIGRAR